MSEFLILGATGKTGRRAVTRLAAAGHAVRAAARTPGPAGPGVTPVHFDWEDRSTWDAALRGADGVYVIPPALRLDYADDVRAFVARAVEMGVPGAVFLSARGADHAPEGAVFQSERAVVEAGWSGAVVRPTWFAQNFTEGTLVPAADGTVAAPTGDGSVPFVDADDIADVVVALLGDLGAHAGRVYELSGPESLTFAAAAAHLGARHVDLPSEAWAAEAAKFIPAEYAGLLAMLFGVIREGHDAHLSDGVQQVLGREPGSFATFAAREGAPATA